MVVGLLVVQLHIPGSQSLKDKRQIVKRIKDRIKNRFNVSVAETDGQNTWRQCELSVAMVAGMNAAVEREFQFILEYIDSVPEVDMTDHWIEHVK